MKMTSSYDNLTINHSQSTEVRHENDVFAERLCERCCDAGITSSKITVLFYKAKRQYLVTCKQILPYGFARRISLHLYMCSLVSQLMPSHSSLYPQEVLLAQFSLCMHK